MIFLVSTISVVILFIILKFYEKYEFKKNNEINIVNSEINNKKLVQINDSIFENKSLIIYSKVLSLNKNTSKKDLKILQNEIQDLLKNDLKVKNTNLLFQENSILEFFYDSKGIFRYRNLNLKKNINIPKSNKIQDTNNSIEFINQISNIESQCLVCLEILNKNDLKYIISCKHSFHKKCIIKWFKTNPSCPGCRISFRIGLIYEIIEYVNSF